MTDTKSDELKAAADGGCARACVEYAVWISEKIPDSGIKDKADYSAAYDYCRKAVEFNILREDPELLFRHYYIIYKLANENGVIGKLPAKETELLAAEYYKASGKLDNDDREWLTTALTDLTNIHISKLSAFEFCFDCAAEYPEIAECPAICDSIRAKAYYICAIHSKGREKFGYLRKAQAFGYKYASDDIACCYANGDGVEKDIDKAIRLSKDMSSSRYYIDGIRFLTNHNGGCFCINNAVDNFKLSCVLPNSVDYIKLIEAQKASDKKMMNTDCTATLPILSEALKNENGRIFAAIEKMLKVKISDAEREKLNCIETIFSYKAPKYAYNTNGEEILGFAKRLKSMLCGYVANNDLHGAVNEKVNTLINSLNVCIGEGAVHRSVYCMADGVKSFFAEKDRRIYRELVKLTNCFELDTVTVSTYRDGKITLYLSNIQSRRCNICDAVISAYAREMFRAYHDMKAKCSEESAEQRIVTQSLASYFEYNYGVNEELYRNKPEHITNGLAGLKKSIKSSWRFDMFVYPYSGAEIISESSRCLPGHVLFRKIFTYSLSSFEKAFGVLHLFYELCFID